jgi:oxygen-independent coproporphyrinogen-3 oxidase
MIQILPEHSRLHEEAARSQDMSYYMRPGGLQFAALPPLSLYVHLPWCLRKCPYCDFNSHALSPSDWLQMSYINALIADLDAALPLVWGRSVQSVFLGGGTPSLFSPQAIDSLLSCLRSRLPLAAGCEISMEANPGTFEKDRFKAYRAAGVTRLSIGVQSFNTSFLKVLGRVHNGEQALAAVQEASEAFDTINMDLMYALQGQSLANWRQDVSTALTFNPAHISIYHLTIEPNTVFAKFPPALVADDLTADMLDLVNEETAAKGLNRYEVSAFAKSGHRCLHNLNYWEFGDYLGIGAGAHSKITFAHRVMRQARFREPERYMSQAFAGAAVAKEEEVSRAALGFEFMLNALRLKDGFPANLYCQRTGLPLSTIEPALDQAKQRGLLVQDWEKIIPTERGFDFLNDLLELFLPAERDT